jgi:uncharacterized protein YdeI (YjbR/CyaY-like superfamily)
VSGPVDEFLARERRWPREFARLRQIVLGLPLVEEVKWGQPCYSWNGANVVLIHGFKDYCALLLPKGVLLKDESQILVQQTENVQAARQIRFRTFDEIASQEEAIRSYLEQAIEVERLGLKVPMKETADFAMSEEFLKALESTPGLQDAFDALTPGRQRGYLLFFGAPKRAQTREERIAKKIPAILAGKGLDD